MPKTKDQTPEKPKKARKKPEASGKKSQLGRPSKFTKELVEKAIELRKQGYIATDIAKQVGIHESTFFNYLADNAEFFELYARATSAYVEARECRIVEHVRHLLSNPPMKRSISEKGIDESIDGAAIQLQRLYVDTEKWAIQRSGRRYSVAGDADTSDIANDDDNDVNVNVKIAS